VTSSKPPGGQRLKLTARQATINQAMYHDIGADGRRVHTVQQIAEEFGVCRPRIYRHLQPGGEGTLGSAGSGAAQSRSPSRLSGTRSARRPPPSSGRWNGVVAVHVAWRRMHGDSRATSSIQHRDACGLDLGSLTPVDKARFRVVRQDARRSQRKSPARCRELPADAVVTARVLSGAVRIGARGDAVVPPRVVEGRASHRYGDHGTHLVLIQVV
jgi:hypothetical protein